MTVPLPPSVARGDPDATLVFMSKQLGVNLSGDNELAVWGELVPPQPASASTVSTQASSVLAAGDATTLTSRLTKKKVTK